MSGRTCILICETYRRELEVVLAGLGADDLHIVTLPARCGMSALLDLKADRHLADHDCSHTISLLPSTCLNRSGLTGYKKGNDRDTQPSQCFYSLADREWIDRLLRDGCYLVTSGWLVSWRKHIDDWGFDRKTAGEFFGEFCRKIVLLDTGIDAASKDHLVTFAEYVKQPWEIKPVGIEFFRLFVSQRVLEMQLEKEREQHQTTIKELRQELTDYALSLELAENLSYGRTVPDVVRNILETFAMLFGARQVVFLPAGDWEYRDVSKLTDAPVDEQALRLRSSSLKGKYAWNEAGDGFLLRVRFQNKQTGFLAVEGMTFPDYRQHYINLALGIIDVCGLALDNARQTEKIESSLQEKEILLQEIHHRVKNSMSVVSALLLLRMDASENQEVISALKDSQNRIETISLVHNALYRSENFSSINAQEYLEQLSGIILEGFTTRQNIDLTVQAGDIYLKASQASPIGLIVNELLTNSLKYAFPDDYPGEISILMTHDGNGTARMIYTDNGVGMPEGFDIKNSGGLGFMLMVRIAERQLGGAINWSGGSGVYMEVVFDLDDG